MSCMDEFYRRQKLLKDKERAKKMGAASNLASYKAKNESEFERKLRLQKDNDRSQKNASKDLLSSYQAGDITEHLEFSPMSSAKKKFHMSSPAGLNFVPDSPRKVVPADDIKSSRQQVELTFLFGLIYDEEALEPEMEECNLAARTIVPDILSKSVQEAGMRCEPKTPVVTGAAEIDDWFDKEGSMRYVIRGRVPVTLFGFAGGEEDDREEAVTKLQKLLKRHVSYRPISPADAEKEKNKDMLVGAANGRMWIRVRESRLGGLGITF